MSNVDATRRSTVAQVASYTTGLAAGLGALIFWSPVLFTEVGTILLNNLAVGFLIAALASVSALLGPARDVRALILLALVAILGLWTLAAPFVLETASDVLTWSNVLAGGLVAVFGALGLVAALRTDRSTTGSTSA